MSFSATKIESYKDHLTASDIEERGIAPNDPGCLHSGKWGSCTETLREQTIIVDVYGCQVYVAVDDPCGCSHHHEGCHDDAKTWARWEHYHATYGSGRSYDDLLPLLKVYGTPSTAFPRNPYYSDTQGIRLARESQLAFELGPEPALGAPCEGCFEAFPSDVVLGKSYGYGKHRCEDP